MKHAEALNNRELLAKTREIRLVGTAAVVVVAVGACFFPNRGFLCKGSGGGNEGFPQSVHRGVQPPAGFGNQSP